MFFRYNAEPARLLHVFKRFRNQALRLRGFRSAYGRGLLAGSVVYGLATVWLTGFSPWFDGDAFFWLIFLTGGLFLLIGWGLAANVARYPRRRYSPGGRWGSVVGLAVLGVMAVLILGEPWSEGWFALASNYLNRSDALGAWGWIGLGVFLLSRWIVWLRLKNVSVEDFELDYLDGVLRPLLRDLPPETVCSLACNPFPPAWTMDFGENKRGSYIFHVYNDVLLEFKAKLAGGAVFTLRTLHGRVDKFKQSRKKLKDKGSKHRVVQSYRIEHPDLARMSSADAEQFEGLAGRWRPLAGAYETTLRRDPKAGRLVVVQKRKFAASRNLVAGDLPSPALVLKTVRELSAFVAGIRSGASR
jgi:hypothetical protein